MSAKFVLVWGQVSALVGGLFVATSGLGVAQEPAQPAAAAAESDPAKSYQAKLDEWKRVLKELRAIKIKFQTAPDSETAALTEQWNQKIAEGEQLIPELRGLGKAAYEAAPNVDLGLVRFLVKMIEDDIGHDRYEEAAALAQPLVDNQCEVKDVYQYAAAAAYVMNDFDKADQYFQMAEEAGALTSELAKKFRSTIPEYKKFWAEEQERRKAEAEKDDLPRVKLTTTKGDLVIELFENEAPETVGNFISLVESKFYDGLTFHRVLGNFMAQGGCPIGNGSGDPGYKIFCECYKDNHRNHFRGSLSMAHAGKDTGGSQFFLTFVPTSHLNGRHTVFGRIIEGMDVLPKLQRINPEDPNKAAVDKIVKAEVLRKRDHQYEPNKVK